MHRALRTYVYGKRDTYDQIVQVHQFAGGKVRGEWKVLMP